MKLNDAIAKEYANFSRATKTKETVQYAQACRHLFAIFFCDCFLEQPTPQPVMDILEWSVEKARGVGNKRNGFTKQRFQNGFLRLEQFYGKFPEHSEKVQEKMAELCELGLLVRIDRIPVKVWSAAALEGPDKLTEHVQILIQKDREKSKMRTALQRFYESTLKRDVTVTPIPLGAPPTVPTAPSEPDQGASAGNEPMLLKDTEVPEAASEAPVMTSPAADAPTGAPPEAGPAAGAADSDSEAPEAGGPASELPSMVLSLANASEEETHAPSITTNAHAERVGSGNREGRKKASKGNRAPKPASSPLKPKKQPKRKHTSHVAEGDRKKPKRVQIVDLSRYNDSGSLLIRHFLSSNEWQYMEVGDSQRDKVYRLENGEDVFYLKMLNEKQQEALVRLNALASLGFCSCFVSPVFSPQLTEGLALCLLHDAGQDMEEAPELRNNPAALFSIGYSLASVWVLLRATLKDLTWRNICFLDEISTIDFEYAGLIFRIPNCPKVTLIDLELVPVKSQIESMIPLWELLEWGEERWSKNWVTLLSGIAERANGSVENSPGIEEFEEMAEDDVPLNVFGIRQQVTGK